MSDEILYLEGRMPCYHPKKAFLVGKHLKTGKPDYFVCSRAADFVWRRDVHDSWNAAVGDPVATMRNGYMVKTDSIMVPCNRCVGCRMDYSRQWADRCILELQYHDSAYFLTLTYNDYCVPRSYYADPDTGEAYSSLTLSKRDWQLFMKRLREAFPNDNLRFFMCGEYGPSTWRPHYHAIVYGLHLDDLVLYQRTGRGYQYYTSAKVDRVWSRRGAMDDLFGEEQKTPLVQMGRVLIGEVTWEACAYTARYMLKKLKGREASFYEEFNLTPPFVLMSRRPGIARQYFDDHPDVYDYSTINVRTPQGGKQIRPPRYFDQLFDAEQPDRMQEIKSNRQKIAEAKMQAQLDKTSLSIDEYLSVQERSLQERIKKLRRVL